MPTNNSNTTTTHSSLTEDRNPVKVHLNKGDFFKVIQIVFPAISSRSTLPILGNILFEATDKGLRLSATDL